MQKFSHYQISRIEEVIRDSIAKESPEELMILPDAALAEKCSRAVGSTVTAPNVNHYRNRIGLAGYSQRLQNLIRLGRNGRNERKRKCQGR